MEFADVVRTRRMVRTYDPERPVPHELVTELLELAVRAPSAGHAQGWRFLVLDEPAACERFWSLTAGSRRDADENPDRWLTGMQTAPALVVCFSDRQAYLERYAESDKANSGRTADDADPWPIPYWHIDTGMAAMVLLLAAQDAGLGACFFGVPGDCWDDLHSAFGVPRKLAPIGVVSLGYPTADHRSPSLRRGRRALNEVVRYTSYADDSSGWSD